jgi:hypothetical protein
LIWAHSSLSLEEWGSANHPPQFEGRENGQGYRPVAQDTNLYKKNVLNSIKGQILYATFCGANRLRRVCGSLLIWCQTFSKTQIVVVVQIDEPRAQGVGFVFELRGNGSQLH